MKYINPFNTLGIKDSPSEINDKYIRRLKKQYLTEFELLESVTITINHQEFDKNSVLQLFDNLLNDNALRFHFEIYQNEPLLNFLENGNFDIFYQDKIQDLHQKDDAFKQFIAPYFAEQFSQHFLKNVKGKRINRIQQMIKYDLPIPIEFQSNCLQPTYRYLKGQMRDVENILRDDFSYKFITHYFKDDLIELLNTLPSYFIGIRNDLVEIIEDLALELHNNHEWYQRAKKLLKLGLKLKVNTEMQYRLQYILDQFNHYPEEYWGKGSPDDKSYRNQVTSRYGRFALYFCIWMLIRLIIGC